MSLKKFIEVNSKRLIGTSLLLSLMAVQSVGAAGTISDEIVSKGNIEYDANSDGTADVYFYSNDLKNIATGIESLNTNVATLQQSFTELGNKTEQYKTNIISGLNSNVYAKANISPDATFEQVIEKINNIPAPTTAVGNVYSGGDNSGLGITANGQSINIDGVTTLNLGINEAITLPSGYYPNDITIQNNVANRGSVESSYISAGYYDEQQIEVSNPHANQSLSVVGPKSFGVSSGQSSDTISYTFTEEGYVYNLTFHADSYYSADGNGHDHGNSYIAAAFYDEDGNIKQDFGSVYDTGSSTAASITGKVLYVYPGDYVRLYYWVNDGDKGIGGSISGDIVQFIFTDL